MESDFVEERQINGKSYKLLQKTRNDADFYCLMGRFFGSRIIAKELGMPMYDDECRFWYIILNGTYPVACASIEIKPQSSNATLKSAWVEPQERGQGLYNWLFSVRLHFAEYQQISTITSTTTNMSKCTHERYGFQKIGQRGKYTVYRKEIER